MPYTKATERVLTDWRAVQHRLDTSPAGTPETLALHEEAQRLRHEYQSLVGKAVARFRSNTPATSISSEPEPG